MKPLFRLATILVIFFIPVLASATLSAQSTAGDFVVAPSVLELTSEINSLLEQEVTFSNNTDFPLLVSAELETYRHPTQSAIIAPRSAVEFISLAETTKAVGPHEQVRFKLEINIPALPEQGSYFALLLMKPSLPPEYYQQYSTQVTPQLASIIAINISDPSVPAKIEYLNLASFDRREEARKIAVDLAAENTDIYYRKVSGMILIQDIYGNNKEVISINDQRILPGHVLSASFLSKDEYKTGFYNIVLALGDDSYNVKREISFFQTPSLAESMAMLAVFFMIALVLYYRSNIYKAMKALIKSAEHDVAKLSKTIDSDY